MSIKMFEKAARGNWNIESQLYWILDVILDEDPNTKKGNLKRHWYYPNRSKIKYSCKI